MNNVSAPDSPTALPPGGAPDPVAPRRTMLAALLALVLIVVGFIVGYGYGYGVYKGTPQSQPAKPAKPSTQWPPITKGLRISPDDRLLAFTGVYDRSRRASRFIVDLKTQKFDAEESPVGWQDYVTQWNADGRTLLLQREKIPRPVEPTTPGLYQAKIQAGDTGPGGNGTPQSGPPKLLIEENGGQEGERVTAGLWRPDGQLVVKARREPKTLYLMRNGQLQLIDRAALTYYQNRAIQEGGKIVYYVVRDIPGQQQVALFRLQDGRPRQLSGAWDEVVWVYLAENARWMIVCQQATDGEDWLWTLYRVTPQGVQLVTKKTVPGDVITVYWSPDFKKVLGASGKSLWLIDIPSLQVRQVGTRKDWDADDAIWLHHQNAAIVAANGRLWKVTLPTGTATKLWEFPEKYRQ